MPYIYMRFPEGKAKALTLSYDDGVDQDIRLIDIMKKSGLFGTFNLNSGLYANEGTVYPEGTIHRRMSEKQVTEVYADSGMEVAVHGLTHPFLEQLPKNVCNYEICQDRKNLEEQFNCIVRGMAYPYGTYNDDVVQMLKDNGIAYARTVKSSHSFQIPEDWLRLYPTCHHNDDKLWELTDKFVSETPQNAPWLFYLWGHSYEFESHNNWGRIEEFATKVGGHTDTWYATNIAIYDYVKAYEQLQFDVSMSRVYNPTALELFFEYEHMMYSVKPGVTKHLKKQG